MANQIKFDLGSMIRQVEELAKAIEKLGVSTQSSFSTMASSTGTLGRAVTDMGQASGEPGDVQYLTPKGGAASGGFARKSIERALENQANIDAYKAYKSGKPGYFETDGTLRYKDPAQHSTSGTFIKNYGDIGVIETEMQRQKERAASAFQKQAAAAAEVPSSVAGEIVKPTRNALGYSAADIPRGLNAQGGIDKVNDAITKAITGLKQSNDDNAKISASILKSLQDRIGEKNEALEKAKADFKADSSEKKEGSTQALINALADLEHAVDDATTATKQSGGGGGEPPKGGLVDKFKDWRIQYGAAALSAGHLLATGAQQYFGASIASRNAVIGQELGIQQARGSLASLQFNREMASVDMRTGSNILKFHGDMFYGNKEGAEFLGPAGLQRAAIAAQADQGRINERDESARAQGRIGALKDIGIGLGAIVGGGVGIATGVGAGFGAAGIGYGLTQVASGIGSLFQGEISSAASAREGISGLTGMAARMTGLSQNEIDAIRTRRQAEDRMNMENYSESLREAQVQQHAKDAFLIDKQLETKAATRAAVLTVGAQYALGRSHLAGTLDHSVSSAYRQTETAAAAVNRGMAAQERRNVGADKATDDFMRGRVGYDDRAILPTSMGIGPYASGVKYAEAKGRTVQPVFPTSAWARFGMSEAEFIGRGAALSNVMGRQTRGENMAQTARISELGMAGLGDFNQLVGNLGNLNQVTGLGNNEKKLEQIMAQAVAIGFDKSRTAQQFVGAVTGLSQSLGITETGSLGRSLGLGAAALSATGQANELSLREAEQGISKYAAFTSQTGGFMGAIKMRAAFQGGMGFGGGAGIMSGKSSEQSMSMLSELESGNITSRELQDLLRLPGNTKEKVAAGLRGQVRASGTLMRASFDVTHGSGKYEEMIDKIKNAKGSKDKQEAMLDFRAYTNEASRQIGLDSMSGMAAGIQDLVSRGAITQTEATQKLTKMKKEGMAAGIDPAQVSLQKYIDKQTRTFDATSNKVDAAKYKEYLMAGGIEQVSGITKDNIDRLSKSEQERLGKELEKLTTVDLAQGAEQAYSATGNVQRVEVVNWRGMGATMLGLGLGEKLNRASNAGK